MRIESAAAASPPTLKRIPRSFAAINGLRGPGALAIAFAHLAVVMDFIGYRHLEAVLAVVDMFFVFSGIVIAQAYAERLTRPSAFPEYIVRRFGRIWPLQAATLGILVLYELVKLAAQTLAGVHFSSPAFAPDGGTLPIAIPTNLLFLHSLGVHDRETWNFPSWSLSVEFATYLLFALFCLVRPRLRHVLSVLTIIASLAVLFFIAPYHMRSTFDYGIFRCMAGFLAGTLCREIATRWEIPKYPCPTLVELLLIGLFVLWIVGSVESYAVYAAPFVISLFLMGFVAERGAVSRVLSSKPLQVLGEASFAIYMVHAVVLIFTLAALHQFAHIIHQDLFVNAPNPLAGRPGASTTVEVFHSGSALVKWAIVVAYLGGVLFASYLAYRWVDVPGRAAFGRLAKRIDLSAIRRPTPTRTVEPMKPSS